MHNYYKLEYEWIYLSILINKKISISIGIFLIGIFFFHFQLVHSIIMKQNDYNNPK